MSEEARNEQTRADRVFVSLLITGLIAAFVEELAKLLVDEIQPVAAVSFIRNAFDKLLTHRSPWDTDHVGEC